MMRVRHAIIVFIVVFNIQSLSGVKCPLDNTSLQPEVYIYHCKATLPTPYVLYWKHPNAYFYLLNDKLISLLNCDEIREVRNVMISPNSLYSNTTKEKLSIEEQQSTNRESTMVIEYDIVSTIPMANLEDVTGEVAMELTVDTTLTTSTALEQAQQIYATVMSTIAGVTGMISVVGMVYGILKKLKNLTKLLPGTIKGLGGGLLDTLGVGADKVGDKSPLELVLDIKSPEIAIEIEDIPNVPIDSLPEPSPEIAIEIEDIPNLPIDSLPEPMLLADPIELEPRNETVLHIPMQHKSELAKAIYIDGQGLGVYPSAIIPTGFAGDALVPAGDQQLYYHTTAENNFSGALRNASVCQNTMIYT